MADAKFHTGDEHVGMTRCPAVEEYVAGIDPVPVRNFLLTYVWAELGAGVRNLLSALHGFNLFKCCRHPHPTTAFDG